MYIHSLHELSKLVQNQRKKLHMTQQQVGDLVGVKQKTISAIENNGVDIRLSTLFRVLAALQLTANITEINSQSSTTHSGWADEW